MKKEMDEHFQIVSSNVSIEDERYLEFRKRWNHYTKTLEVSPAPLHVDIELTNACNLRCSMCERNKMKRKTGFMDYGLFRAIIDDCAKNGIRSVKLSLWGESLLHKELFKMIGYAKDKGLYTQFNTNATFVTADKAHGLIDSGLDRLTISIESIIKDMYEDTRKGADFDRTIGNIGNFIELKPVGRKPYLTIQIIRMKRNEAYIGKFVNRFKDRVDFVSVTNITSADGDPGILKESLVDYKSLPDKPCPQPWQRLSVFWNGDVTVCCADYDGFLKIGNVKKDSLTALWNGDKINHLREKHKKLDFGGLICRTCTSRI